MRTDDGGPAFPAMNDQVFDGAISIVSHHGMSLRDYFAAAALTSTASDCCWDEGDKPKLAVALAQIAYGIADAMLAERAK